MSAPDLLSGRTLPAFLAQASPRDREWRRVALMVALGPLAAIALSFAVILLLFASGHALGIPLNVLGGEMAGLPRLMRSGVYILEVGLGLAAAAAGLLLAGAVIFRRRLGSWVTAATRFRWSLLGWGLAAGGLALVGLSLAAQVFADEGGVAPIFDSAEPASQRLVYALTSFSGFMIAAWAEEVVFRGYLLQQMSAFSRRLWLVLLVNGLVFALFHLEFDPGALAARTLLGMVLAWSALRLGGLEFGIGAHAAQNLGIALFGEVLLPDTPQTVIDGGGLGMEVLLAVILIVCVEVLYRRRAGLQGDPISTASDPRSAPAP